MEFGPSLQSAPPSLLRLTFVSCGGFSGKGLETLSTVTQLTLLDQVAISGEGLQHVFRKALPALEAIALHVTQVHGKGCCLKYGLGLNALLSGSHLKLIDLRGTTGLTDRHVTQLKHAIQIKQARGVMQPSVTLVLSVFFNLTAAHSKFSDAQLVLQRTVQRMFVPNLFAWPGTCIANKTVITEQRC